MKRRRFYGIVAGFMPVRDLDRSIDWYMSHMDFELQYRDDEHRAAGLSAENDVWLNLVEVKDVKPIEFPENQFSTDIFFNFKAADIEEVYRDFKENGVEIVTDMFESYDQQFRCFTAKDPDGNRISVVS